MRLTDKIEVHNVDCLPFMRELPDNAYDLGIVDPPYGIGRNWQKDSGTRFYKHKLTYQNNETPDIDYFNELMRISVNQIIWGANYYTPYLPARQSWIVWDKKRSQPRTFNAEGELAWHSFNIPLRIFTHTWNGCVRGSHRYGVHPHEKPVLLYEWLLENYAKQGDTIFDSHFGSLSIGIACHYLGFELTACEIDKEYFDTAVKRFKEQTAQIQINFTKSKQYPQQKKMLI